MPTITCPNCDMTFDVETTILGKKVQCAYCQEVFVADQKKEQEIIILRHPSETVQNCKKHSMVENISESPQTNNQPKQSGICNVPSESEKEEFITDQEYNARDILEIALTQKRLIIGFMVVYSICAILLCGALFFPPLLGFIILTSLFFQLPMYYLFKTLRIALGKDTTNAAWFLFLTFFLPIIGFLFYLPSVFAATKILRNANVPVDTTGVRWSTIKELEQDAVFCKNPNMPRPDSLHESLTALGQFSNILLFGPLSSLFNSPPPPKDNGHSSRKQ